MSMMTRHRQEDPMRPALHLALLSLLACYPAQAQEYEHGTALLCDSAFQIIRILVVGVDTPQGIRPVRPTPYFSAFEVVEFDV
jgi:hypothetical protein